MTRSAPALLALLLSVAAVRADPPPLAAKARAVLAAHCAPCHGDGGKAKGGFGYALDRERLVARSKVVPGKPADSELYERVRGGDMPPLWSKRRPSGDELATLKQWIEAGAPDWQTAVPRAFARDEVVLRLAVDDLGSLPERQRRFMRYVTFAHLANAGLPDVELRAHAQALAKLVNSLSWHPRVTAPESVDAAHTVFRIDLRDYKWNARSWERLVAAYPYRPAEETPDGKALAAATGSDLPLLRGDWLVATASRPPLYHDLLGLPDRDKALERLAGVELLTDLQEETAARAGFNGSGVSRNNRIIERHDASYGAYWRTYDFADNTERRNIFEHPLGPAAGGGSFIPDGGEIIFHLPNGLQGYMLVDGAGRRIDRAPVEIVSDPKRPDRVVENGLSCMSCHAQGVIAKADQVRAHVLKSRASFAAAEVASVKALYPTEAALKARFDEDAERFTRALAKLGIRADEPEPVSAAALRYEGTLDLATMAAELGLQAPELAEQLKRSPGLSRLLGPLAVKGGTVQRSVVVASFADIAREVLRARAPSAAAGPELSPFTGHEGAVACVAFAPDGKRALSGGDDMTLRLWDAATGKELRRFEGHRDAVTAVAFSADGRLAASGGRDRGVRLWEVETGRERVRLDGHTGTVRCVAFSPDGKTLLSGGEEAALRLWDVGTGKELRRLVGHTADVTAVAFSPDGRLALSGSHDRSVRLWDVASGKQLLAFDGHTREVYAVAFSADGKRAASGGNDRTVRLWDVSGGKELRRLDGHANAVIRVAFLPEGKRVISGSSQYQSADRVVRVWDADTGRQLHAFDAGEGESVGCVAFAPDGMHALAGGSAKSLRLWKLSK
jgi:WD40 repeat protein/mono/diheme cytochrome c family protein